MNETNRKMAAVAFSQRRYASRPVLIEVDYRCVALICFMPPLTTAPFINERTQMKPHQLTNTSGKSNHAIRPSDDPVANQQVNTISAKNKAFEALAHRLASYIAERLLNDLESSSSLKSLAKPDVNDQQDTEKQARSRQ